MQRPPTQTDSPDLGRRTPPPAYRLLPENSPIDLSNLSEDLLQQLQITDVLRNQTVEISADTSLSYIADIQRIMLRQQENGRIFQRLQEESTPRIQDSRHAPYPIQSAALIYSLTGDILTHAVKSFDQAIPNTMGHIISGLGKIQNFINPHRHEGNGAFEFHQGSLRAYPLLDSGLSMGLTLGHIAPIIQNLLRRFGLNLSTSMSLGVAAHGALFFEQKLQQTTKKLFHHLQATVSEQNEILKKARLQFDAVAAHFEQLNQTSTSAREGFTQLDSQISDTLEQASILSDTIWSQSTADQLNYLERIKKQLPARMHPDIDDANEGISQDTRFEQMGDFLKPGSEKADISNIGKLLFGEDGYIMPEITFETAEKNTGPEDKKNQLEKHIQTLFYELPSFIPEVTPVPNLDLLIRGTLHEYKPQKLTQMIFFSARYMAVLTTDDFVRFRVHSELSVPLDVYSEYDTKQTGFGYLGIDSLNADPYENQKTNRPKLPALSSYHIQLVQREILKVSSLITLIIKKVLKITQMIDDATQEIYHAQSIMDIIIEDIQIPEINDEDQEEILSIISRIEDKIFKNQTDVLNLSILNEIRVLEDLIDDQETPSLSKNASKLKATLKRIQARYKDVFEDAGISYYILEKLENTPLLKQINTLARASSNPQQIELMDKIQDHLTILKFEVDTFHSKVVSPFIQSSGLWAPLMKKFQEYAASATEPELLDAIGQLNPN